MKSPADRGRIGAWAYEARADADLSVEAVVERLARAGHPVTAATLRGVEGGSKQPSRRLLRALAGVYERPAPGDNMAPPADTTMGGAALISALERQTEAISELVRLVRTGDEDREARLRALEAEVRSLREQREGEASPGRSVPQTTAG